jgi:hypothetical protein
MDGSEHELPPAPPVPPANSAALLFAILESLPFRVHACNQEGVCILQNQVSLREFGNFVGRRATEVPLPDVITLAGALRRAGEVSARAGRWFAGELRNYRSSSP